MLARMAAFKEAIRLDPKFAKARVGAADAQIGYAGQLRSRPRDTFLVQAGARERGKGDHA